MNSLRARSVPAQLMVGTRASSASGVATSALSPTAGPAISSTPWSTSSPNARSIANAVPTGQTQARGVHELDLPIESTALDQIVDGEPHERLGVTAERGALFHRVRHVVEDADADRDGHVSTNPS